MPACLVAFGEPLPAKVVVVLDDPAAIHRSPDEIDLSMGRQSFGGRLDFGVCDGLRVPGIGEGERLRWFGGLASSLRDWTALARQPNRTLGTCAHHASSNRTRKRAEGRLLHDRHLGIFDNERLEFSGAAVLILGGHGITDDAGRCGVRHDPLGDPELTFGLLRLWPGSASEDPGSCRHK